MTKFPFVLAITLAFVISVHAQSFSSGSTGADGALDLFTLSCTTCEVQLPESGVLNYTTVSIPSGKVLKFKRNLRNTPVIMLTQGGVSIAGVVSLSASSKDPGPGGFYGGQSGQPGFGPGGGSPADRSVSSGRWVGPLSLVPIVGGSGAAGLLCSVVPPGSAGGGGAIVIASSTSITLSGSIQAQGGVHDPNCSYGAGGAIRLVANSLDISGGFSACGGNCGVVRLEAPSGALVYTGSSSPAAGLFPINPTVLPSASPSLTFASIGSFPVPSYAGQRFDTYDMLLPNQLSDPISIVVQANNIPVGTQVTVGVVNGSPNGTSTPGTLSGTFASSSATATISNLNRTAVTYLLATATFDPPMGAMHSNPKGSNHVAKIRVVASPGGKPKFVFLRKNGTEVEVAKLPKQFLGALGL